MTQANVIRVLASHHEPIEGIEFLPLGPWLKKSEILWEGALPLCAIVSAQDRAAFAASPLAGFLADNSVPVVSNPAEALARSLQTERHESATLRAQSAALRRDYMRLQQSFAETEDFLNAAFAPTFTCARAWEPVEAACITGKTEQRLPTGSIGLVAVDVWAMGAGKGHVSFGRLTGPDFGDSISIKATAEGWVRAMLPLPLSGLAEDVVIRVKADFKLGLSQPVPLGYMHASGAKAPLALRVWKGLPGCRIPEMRPRGERFVVPASALPAPEVSGGTAKLMRGRDAYSLHPGHDGKMDFVFRGIEVPSAANIAAYTQNFGPEPVTLALAASDGEVARRNMLPPDSHVQCDLFVTGAGAVDLHFKLRAASPLVSVFLRGVEIVPMVE